MALLRAIPALPVLDIDEAVEFYADRLAFDAVHVEAGFAVLRRDAVVLHLWAADKPDVPGAEPRLAGSASCRVAVDDVQSLYDELAAAGVVHPNGHLAQQEWGETDFTVLDADGNAIAFFAPTSP